MPTVGRTGISATLAAAGLFALDCGARTALVTGDAPDAASAADADPVVDVTVPPEVAPVQDAGPRVLLDCPTALDDPRLPSLAPGRTGVIDGQRLARVPIASFRWSVVDQGCDAMLPEPRYQLSGARSPTVTFGPARPGAYELGLEVQTADGQTEACAFQVWSEGHGLLVELCWDTSTSIDLDLYLHRPDSQEPWYTPGSVNVLSGINNGNCNTVGCAAELRFGLTRTDWGYSDSPLERCDMGPDWAGFQSLGRCPNPRAADDNNQVIAIGTAELIQLDNPRDGETFRIMVQNFENLPAQPYVYVYCGGVLRRELGPPDWPPGFALPGATGFGVMWRPADVRVQVDPNGVTAGCAIEALRSPDGSRDHVTIDDPGF